MEKFLLRMATHGREGGEENDYVHSSHAKEGVDPRHAQTRTCWIGVRGRTWLCLPVESMLVVGSPDMVSLSVLHGNIDVAGHGIVRRGCERLALTGRGTGSLIHACRGHRRGRNGKQAGVE